MITDMFGFSRIIIVIAMLLPAISHGQTLTGKVVDQSNQPIPQVYLIHTASEHHAHTDEFGKFLLHGVKQGDTIQVIHIGYEEVVQAVESLEAPFNVKLKEKVFELDEVVVGNAINSLNSLASIDLKLFPVNSSQQILRKVPGLFIGQHAGGGKAEQIFLRGFDIDHGTDVSLSVDGMPVNMVSHAHGQGYSDFHFLIPETVGKVDFDKGPYSASHGNFSTAGYVDFKTKDQIDNSSVKLEVGKFNTVRTLGMFEILNTEKQNAYIATEYLLSDGPFNSSQNFNRLNIFAKYKVQLPQNSSLSLSLSHFTSKWDASGQIPVRAVNDGTIDRFGAIDDTEGGSTSRTNINLGLIKNIDDRTFINNRAYVSLYDFELYSNFTFFANDPINGDQIRQAENRLIFGVESSINRQINTGTTEVLLSGGLGLRYDDVNDSELSRTRIRRETLSNIQLGAIDETNIYGFLNAELEWRKWLINPAVRVDHFNFEYINELDNQFRTLSTSETTVSPKLNILYNYNRNLQLFAKSGVSFHSNDTRVIVENVVDEILPSAFGVDVGTIWKPFPRLVINAALWHLFLEQEFVYVGDEGIVEPSGRSRRQGVDFGFRYQLTDWLFFNSDLNVAKPRSIDEPEGSTFIPLAPTLTTVNSVNVRIDNFNLGVRTRYIRDRPANEDNSIVAEGYFITDLNANYKWRSLTLGTRIENLFDVDWNETQFATESRLRNEAQSVEEIHFTPGTPFFISFSLQYDF